MGVKEEKVLHKRTGSEKDQSYRGKARQGGGELDSPSALKGEDWG